MKVEVSKAVDVFFSYAHQDDELKRELEKQLSFLKRQGLISGWNDRDIKAGQEWTSEIDIHLNAAQIILLLISPDFIASDYCYSVEMKQAMKRQEAGKVRIIPIILRPVYWHDEPFSKFQVLPTEGKPVTTWINRDEAFLDIARGIREVVRDLLKERWLEKSKTLRKSNNYIEALSAIEKAIQLDPTYAQAFCEKGIIYRDRPFDPFDEYPFDTNYDKALAAFEKAVQLDPSYASAHYEKAGLYYLIKNYKDA